MTPAPATGRTADENELREEIRSAIKGRWDLLTGPALDNAAIAGVPGAWRRKDLCDQFADALLSGPLAPILQEAAHLRAENANLRDRVREAEGAAEEIQSYPSTFDEALAYIRPPSGADSMAPVTLNAGMLRCCVSAILMRVSDRTVAAEQEAATLRARLQEAEKALKPFAKAGELFGPRESDSSDQAVYMPAAGPEYGISGDDLRRARAALATPVPQTQETGDATV